MIGKILLLIYKLDILTYMKIHSIISIVYLSRYRIHEDLYHCVPLSLGFVEYGSDFETLADEVRDGQY